MGKGFVGFVGFVQFVTFAVNTPVILISRYRFYKVWKRIFEKNKIDKLGSWKGWAQNDCETSEVLLNGWTATKIFALGAQKADA